MGNLQFTLEDNHATVSWEAPVNGANGGHFDAELLKYILVRYPGNDTINAEYTATVFTEDLPDVLGNYYYTVTAVAEKRESPPNRTASTSARRSRVNLKKRSTTPAHSTSSPLSMPTKTARLGLG